MKQKKRIPVALNKNNPIRARRDLIDADYLHKLSPEELAFYTKFISETALADFRHKDEGLLFPDQKRQLYRENNARNRDALNKSPIEYKDVIGDGGYNPEDSLNSLIDNQHEIKLNKAHVAFDNYVQTLPPAYRNDLEKHTWTIIEHIKSALTPDKTGKRSKEILETELNVLYNYVEDCIKNNTLPSQSLGKLDVEKNK